MKTTALITGASRGIGAEFAKIIASQGSNLVLTARDEKDLEQLKNEIEQQYNVSVKIIVQDLSDSQNVDALYDELIQNNIQINYLINNAGFGDYAYFENSDWKRQESMIDLNVTALVKLCHLFVQHWDGKKPARILNVSSTASFQPGPGMSVYYATKAFVTNFSQALNYELKKKGVTVTTLCPGPTKSHFAETAQVSDASKLFKNSSMPMPYDVALFGVKAMMKGKSVAIHGSINSLLAFFTRFVPRGVMTKLSAKILEWK